MKNPNSNCMEWDFFLSCEEYVKRTKNPTLQTCRVFRGVDWDLCVSWR